jgi:hypothetical protein
MKLVLTAALLMALLCCAVPARGAPDAGKDSGYRRRRLLVERPKPQDAEGRIQAGTVPLIAAAQTNARERDTGERGTRGGNGGTCRIAARPPLTARHVGGDRVGNQRPAGDA